MDMLEKLREKLEEKIDKEYKDFVGNLMKERPEVIIERAYEKVCKEEMCWNIKNKDYSIKDLKALLKADGVLEDCYDAWLNSDDNFNEMLGYVVDDRISNIIENISKKTKNKDKGAR